MLKTAGAFGDEEVVNKAAVRATVASDKALKTQEMRVDKALAQQKREEAEAATDKAVADKVLADAMKNQDEEQRTRLLKAATAQYEKAAEESAKAKASAKESAKHIIAPATPATRVSEGQGVAGEGKAVKEGKDVNEVKKAVKAAEDEADKVEVSLPKALAKGSVTISFSHMRDGKVASKVAIDTQEVGPIRGLCICIYVCMYYTGECKAAARADTHIYICRYVYIYTYIYIYVHVCAYIYNVYICIHTHTHTHVCI